MSECRTISKYPNRRLYDPTQGRYVTLADVRKLVNERVEFVVLDRKTGADITCAVLVQVVSGEEKGAAGVFRRDFLLDLIRSVGDPTHGAVGDYLERALAIFIKNTAAPQGARGGDPTTPAGVGVACNGAGSRDWRGT